MRRIETLSGNGTVTPADGKPVRVRYTLNILQEEINVGTGTIPGLKSIHGAVRPFCGALRERLTLRMEDGRTVDFFFTDMNGSVVGTGGVSTFTLHEDAWLRDGPIFASGQAIGYRVGGMPNGGTARIANFGAPNRNDWRIMRINPDNSQSEWSGQLRER